LFAVREDHRNAGGDAAKVENQLVRIELSESTLPISADQQNVIFSATDFVACPNLAPNGKHLAFVSWSHPNMPWDNTEIRVLALDDQAAPPPCIQIDEGCTSSKLQPRFDENNRLYFLCDRSNFWNIRCCDVNDEAAAEDSSALFDIDSDCCGPAWETGRSNFDFIDTHRIAFTQVKDCRWVLSEFDQRTDSLNEIHKGLGQLEQVHCRDEKVFYLAANDTDYASLYRWDLNSNSPEKVYDSPIPNELSKNLIAEPTHFSFPTANGAIAYALFYAPKNPDVENPDDELPPLIVNVHGGPTGTARAALNPMHQFWTSNGFAVMDLNHRGSTGYGREFRKSLYENWGVVDLEDVIHGVRYLIDEGRVDGKKVAIRGGSAGGYLVLASLANSDLFAAGVSYYGVADLELLAKDTHKFESRYLDQLVGPYPETIERYQDRSPISKLDQIKTPVLLLQGDEDKVVPPNQAQLLYDAIVESNPASELIRYPNEGHGFRKPANQIGALKAELQFYRKNL